MVISTVSWIFSLDFSRYGLFAISELCCCKLAVFVIYSPLFTAKLSALFSYISLINSNQYFSHHLSWLLFQLLNVKLGVGGANWFESFILKFGCTTFESLNVKKAQVYILWYQNDFFPVYRNKFWKQRKTLWAVNSRMKNQRFSAVTPRAWFYQISKDTGESLFCIIRWVSSKRSFLLI